MTHRTALTCSLIISAAAVIVALIIRLPDILNATRDCAATSTGDEISLPGMMAIAFVAVMPLVGLGLILNGRRETRERQKNQ